MPSSLLLQCPAESEKFTSRLHSADSFRGVMDQNGDYWELSINLEKPLGLGSDGCVYKGEWQAQNVAVKVMTSKKGRKEAMISVGLCHPNIAQTLFCGEYEVCQADEVCPIDAKSLVRPTSKGPKECMLLVSPNLSCLNPMSQDSGMVDFYANGPMSPSPRDKGVCIVRELCEHGSLGCALARRSFFCKQGLVVDLGSILGLLGDVARGLSYLHSIGIRHGDLKCDNVLLQSVDAKGNIIAKLTDFACSQTPENDSIGTQSLAYGTVTHMAPETIGSGVVLPASDVYSFGIIMWEMCTASLPYAGMKPSVLMHRVLDNNLRPDFPAHIPSEYVKLAVDCWQADPKLRPSAVAVEERICSLLENVKQLQMGMEDQIKEFLAWSALMF